MKTQLLIIFLLTFNLIFGIATEYINQRDIEDTEVFDSFPVTIYFL